MIYSRSRLQRALMNLVEGPAGVRATAVLLSTDSSARAEDTTGGGLAIPNNALTALTFNTTVYDSDNYHSTTVNTGRLTVPRVGTYLLGLNVAFAPNAVGYRAIGIRKNGVTLLTFTVVPTVAAINMELSCVTTATAVVGDYFDTQVIQNSGAALNTVVLVGRSPDFWISQIA